MSVQFLLQLLLAIKLFETDNRNAAELEGSVKPEHSKEGVDHGSLAR